MTYRVDAGVLGAARAIRAELLARPSVERALGGQCALASRHLAEAIGHVAAFRIGFFMRHETFLGQRGRYPNPHAWCLVDSTIVDVTATQFGRFPAVYVVAAIDTDRYIECAQGTQAINEVMREWMLDRVPEYRRLRRRLRKLGSEA